MAAAIQPASGRAKIQINRQLAARAHALDLHPDRQAHDAGRGQEEEARRSQHTKIPEPDRLDELNRRESDFLQDVAAKGPSDERQALDPAIPLPRDYPPALPTPQ